MRWEVKAAVQNIENIIVKYRERESQDGIWIYFRHFTNDENIKCHTAKSLVMPSGAKGAISHEIHKIEEQERKPANKRSTLFSSKNTISCWKANKLEFYDCSLKIMSETK